MDPIKEALTFDDVTLVPKYSEILPSEVDTKVELSKNLSLGIPILSSAMDTVTESKMAIAIAQSGGIGIIHRNLNVKKQIQEIKKVKKKKLLVGAAVGAGPKEIQRVKKATPKRTRKKRVLREDNEEYSVKPMRKKKETKRKQRKRRKSRSSTNPFDYL